MCTQLGNDAGLLCMSFFEMVHFGKSWTIFYSFGSLKNFLNPNIVLNKSTNKHQLLGFECTCRLYSLYLHMISYEFLVITPSLQFGFDFVCVRFSLWKRWLIHRCTMRTFVGTTIICREAYVSYTYHGLPADFVIFDQAYFDVSLVGMR